MWKIIFFVPVLISAPAVGFAGEAADILFKPLEFSQVSVDGGLSRGVTWGDMDGDGFPDLAVANTIGQLDFLYHNNGDGSFTQRHEIPFTLNNGWTEGITWIDFDNDGDLDIFVVNNGGPGVLMRNDGGNAHRWLQVALEGVVSNRSAIGAKLRLVVGAAVHVRQVGAQSSYCSQSSLIEHFGLGVHSEADTLEITWPSGNRQVFYHLVANQRVHVLEGETLLQ